MRREESFSGNKTLNSPRKVPQVSMVNLSSNFPFAYKLDLLIKDIISLIESEVLQSTNCEEVLSNCKFYIDKIFYFANSDSIAANI